MGWVRVGRAPPPLATRLASSAPPLRSAACASARPTAWRERESCEVGTLTLFEVGWKQKKFSAAAPLEVRLGAGACPRQASLSRWKLACSAVGRAPHSRGASASTPAPPCAPLLSEDEGEGCSADAASYGAHRRRDPTRDHPYVPPQMPYTPLSTETAHVSPRQNFQLSHRICL